MSEIAHELRMRRATLADLPALMEVNASTARGPHWPEGVWQRRLADADSRAEAVLLLEEAATAKVQGWITGTLLLGVSEIEFVLVRAASRGRGLGEALVREWLRWSSGHGATEVQLEVRAGNDRALRLYRKLGFAEQGRRPRYYSEPVEDALLMALCLNQEPATPPAGTSR